MKKDKKISGGSNSRLVFTVNAGTTYRILVSAFGSNQGGGAYTLSIRVGGGPAA